jgi:iron complex outermembrane receptor protein
VKPLFTAAMLCLLPVHTLAGPHIESGSIRGSVSDGTTGEAIAAANIRVKTTTLGASSTIEGEFEVKGIPPGTYTLVVSSVGYETKEVAGVEVSEGKSTVVNVALTQTTVQLADLMIFGASLKNEKITDAPAAVTVLDAKAIKLNSVSGQVARLLETQSGIDIVQSGVNDYNVNTRGFNSSLNRRLLVLLDGRDLAVAFLGSQEWNGFSVPVEDLGRMEFIRGPGSALYGANAFNGVVNLSTPAPREIAGGKITLAGGELNTIRTDIRYAGVTDRWGYKLNAGHVQSNTWSVSRDTSLADPFEYDGLNPFLNLEVIPVDRSKVASTYGSARLDYEYEVGGSSTVEGGITQVENEILVTGIGRVQVPKAVKPWGRLKYSTESWYLQVWGAGRNSIEPQVSLSTGLPLEEESFIGQFDVQYRTSAMEDRLFVIVGGAHRYQFVNTDGTLTLSSHHDNTSSLYTQLEYRLNSKFKSVGAARWDRSTLHSSQVSPKIAVVWTLDPSHSIRATFNKAFQAPNYSELFLYVKHPFRQLAYFGNENLTVETITGYELGYKGVFGSALFVTADAYYNQLKDFITDLAPGANPSYPGRLILPGETLERTIWSYGNAGKVTEAGIEVEASYDVSEAVRLSANYAFFDFDVKEQGANDVLLPNAPGDKFNVGVIYRKGAVETQIAVKYVPGFEWAAGIFRGRILAYALVNVSASYSFTSAITLSTNITNLLDRSHYEIFGGSLIGRRAVVSLTATF